ncbi:hypothetical protein CCP1ISM_90008 [Azospirillaceae bacterium]
MKAVILQDIIIESNGINIIKSGSTILIDEGIKDIAASLKSKIINFLGDKSMDQVNGFIKQYAKSLSANELVDFKRQIGVDHIGKTQGDDNYTTIVRGPMKYLEGIRHSIPEKYETTLQPSYNYDIDDLVELERRVSSGAEPNGQVPEDTIKEFGKLHINRITEVDYQKAMQKARELAKKQAAEPAAPSEPAPEKHSDLAVNANSDNIETNETEDLRVPATVG